MSITFRGWALLLLAVVLGFAVLHLVKFTGPWRLVPAILFPLVPLLALRAVAGRRIWAALFRPVSLSDAGLALAIALLNIVVTFAIGALITQIHSATVSANPAFAGLNHEGISGRIWFFAASVPQLLGEEILTIVPFLALLTWFTNKLRVSRERAIFCAWILSALPFALAHLPTYQWNLVQCLLIIGSARLVLSLAYLRTGNLLVCAMAHVLNDWILFGGGLWLASFTQGV